MVADHQGGEHQGGMNPSEARQDDFRLWHVSDMPTTLRDVRFRG
jgi:hypothetical protein